MMETRSNNVLVGSVVMALLFAMAGFFMWLANDGGGSRREYDIFFGQSVEGLNRGGTVLFNGVPVGEVQEIALWPDDPKFVRVRISVVEKVPILQGTSAVLAGVGFTGVSQITLDGAVKGAPEITDAGPGGRPVIPTRTGGLGALLDTAPQLLNRLTTLSDRLNELASDRNLASLANILANVETVTGNLASNGAAIDGTIADARTALAKAAVAAEQIGTLTGSAQAAMDNQVGPAVGDLRRTLANADKSLASLDATLQAARPGLTGFSETSVPEFNAALRDVRRTANSLTTLTEKLESGGAGALVGGSKLPDYKDGK